MRGVTDLGVRSGDGRRIVRDNRAGCVQRGSARQAPATATAATVRFDSSTGEVRPVLLMKDAVGWLTDSNLVALATMVNEAPVRLARIESQQSTDQAIHAFALEVIRDHTRSRLRYDSLAGSVESPAASGGGGVNAGAVRLCRHRPVDDSRLSKWSSSIWLRRGQSTCERSRISGALAGTLPIRTCGRCWCHVPWRWSSGT